MLRDKSKSIIKLCWKQKTLFRRLRLKLRSLAAEVLTNFAEGEHMTCPGCGSNNEMAYSTLSYSFICLEPSCGVEVEMDPLEAQQVLEPEEELVCC